MALLVQQPPVEGVGLVPLLLLADLLAHEEELLAGVTPLVGVQGTQTSQTLPLIAGHLRNQRTLTVHDLVVRQREHVVLGEGVHQREGKLAVVPAAVDRILAEVAQGVVHPAHIPLHAVAEATAGRRGSHAGPRRGLLGDHDDAGVTTVRGRVRFLNEVDGLQVLAATVLVRTPLAVLARVIQVQHRGHSVNAQTVDVEVLKPVQGVGNQEVAHLAAAEVEDVGAPVGVLAAQRVRVLVQRGAVEAGQREVVLGEVGGDPVQDDADALAVESVHQVAEVVRGSVARGGRVVGGHLVAPRATEGVLGQRHEFHVREAHLLDVGDQLVGQFAVAEALTPGARVDLVDGHGAVVDVAFTAGLHPLLVAPLVEVVGDDRGRGRGNLGGAGHRVGLLEPVAAGALDLELVAGANPDLGDENLPHAGRTQRTH